ncbi:MAG: hypothetical protein IPM68_14315 [Flavobacteriales bacterium]|nr:hypothetical protein [Flavobacteriales bacterium]
MLLSFSGVDVMFLTAFTLLKDGISPHGCPRSLFTSPMVAYYANNFLPNAAALGLVLRGWHATASGDPKERTAHGLSSR